MYTGCVAPRSFGVGVFLAASSVFLPASHGDGLCPAFRERTWNPPERAIIRNPGENPGFAVAYRILRLGAAGDILVLRRSVTKACDNYSIEGPARVGLEPVY